jgi:hypothetical protein
MLTGSSIFEKRKARIVRILLAFSPFIVFAIVDRLVGSTEGLIGGAVIAVVLIVRDWKPDWQSTLFWPAKPGQQSVSGSAWTPACF